MAETRSNSSDLKLIYRSVETLIPYARNARTHSDGQVAQIAGSIREFGFASPVLLAADGTIIAGHGRVMAARQLGLTEVPAITLGHLTENQRRALALADNRIALSAGWDEELLALELADLKEAGIDLGLLGFDPAELQDLLAGKPAAGLTDEDAAPALPVDPVSRPGDCWALGPHRLLCGDATKAAAVAGLLEGRQPHLMVTDPPYGVSYNPAWRNRAGVSTTRRTGRVANDDRADWEPAWALFRGDAAYVWHAAVHATTVAESLVRVGFDLRAQIVWSKPRFALGRGDYHWQHEPCWYAVRRGGRSHWQGARDQSTVWSIGMGGQEDTATVHGTQKPVEVMRRPIVNNSTPGDLIYEPFAGSGTTLIAAETVGRVCQALELDPAWCDVIVQRWQNFTGRQATLDGMPFAQVAVERLGKAAASPAASVDAE